MASGVLAAQFAVLGTERPSRAIKSVAGRDEEDEEFFFDRCCAPNGGEESWEAGLPDFLLFLSDAARSPSALSLLFALI
jgi:hypothetical protein